MPRMGERDVADESISPTTKVTMMSKSPSPSPSSRGPTISPPSTPPPQQQQQQSRFHEQFTPPPPSANNNNKPSSEHMSAAAAAPMTPPPVPTPTEEDDIATLNFDRRPSHFDPIAPSFHQRGAAQTHPSQPARNLVSSSSATGFVPLPPVSPLQQHSPRSTTRRHQRGGSSGSGSGMGLSHRKRGSHSRQPSMSLASPTSPTHSHSEQQQRKILPLEPAAQRALPTRAPLEAFASVEMLQGQRQHQDRTRGVEVFGPGGTYEGRASSQSVSSFSSRALPASPVFPSSNSYVRCLAGLCTPRGPAFEPACRTQPGSGSCESVPELQSRRRWGRRRRAATPVDGRRCCEYREPVARL